jgi:drug/metabolite transporter (DMT)-like permease
MAFAICGCRWRSPREPVDFPRGDLRWRANELGWPFNRIRIPPVNVSANFRGIAAMIVAAATFVANDSCMKLALEDLPPLEVLILRGLGACLWCLPILVYLGQGRELLHVLNRWVVLRGLCEVVAILSFIFALKHMPIADITAIVQTSPLLVLAGSALIWGDRIGPLRLVLIALGLGGALLVAQPGSSVASPFAIFGFATAAGAAGRDLVSRKVDPTIPALVVAFATVVIVLLAAGLGAALFETALKPSAYHVGLMTAAGFFLMCGHLFIFLAYRVGQARVVAPFNYSFTIWAVISGGLLFGDFPNGLALAGMALIMISGLAIILFEGRTRPSEVML